MASGQTDHFENCQIGSRCFQCQRGCRIVDAWFQESQPLRDRFDAITVLQVPREVLQSTPVTREETDCFDNKYCRWHHGLINVERGAVKQAHGYRR